MSNQTIIIDGNNFTDLESFYSEIDRVLTKNISFKTGHNLDAFSDILCGDFGVFNYNETIKLVWINFIKSKRDLGEALINELIEIINGRDYIEFSTID